MTRKSAWEIRATPGDGVPVINPDSCPIRERTGDGVSVGRCWSYCKDGVCPRHGDVTGPMAEYRASGRLTDENDLPVSPKRLRSSTPST